jgi:hypothetical protein
VAFPFRGFKSLTRLHDFVLQGSVGKRAFTEFEAQLCRTEQYARDHLHKHGVPHYWDMALADAIKDQA